jgi:hypothetical protein
MSNDDKELNEILEAVEEDRDMCERPPRYFADVTEDDEEEEILRIKYEQWASSDNKSYFPAAKTRRTLPAGVYEINKSTSGLYFERIPIKTEGLIQFPQSNSDKVIDEIKKFWEREDKFKEYNLTYKRGIILWGPPGSGKSCTIQIVMKDVIDRNGIVIKFTHPELFSDGIRILREIQSESPVIVLMEDIDAILEIYSESSVLNILDGVDQIDKMVFLATTNYPERLGARILNRPSRFDKRFKIGHPNAESRRLYFEHVIGQEKIEELQIDLEEWVDDTDGFSIAHLKELFIAVYILGDDYEASVETLASMKEQVMADDEFDRPLLGFGAEKKKKISKKHRM